jgi:tRNA-uridine 2-sulfurtransferase
LELQNGQQMRYDLRIRYRQALTAATLYKEKDALYIVFDEAQRGVTPGQFAAWYAGDELIGSGVID